MGSTFLRVASIDGSALTIASLMALWSSMIAALRSAPRTLSRAALTAGSSLAFEKAFLSFSRSSGESIWPIRP